MKRILISLLCLAVLAGMYACVNSGGLLSDQPDEASDQGTETGAIAFQKAALEDLSGDIRNSVRPDRAEQGYDILQSDNGFYLVVYAGERPTGRVCCQYNRDNVRRRRNAGHRKGDGSCAGRDGYASAHISF